jgi:calcium-binding protein CML
MADYNRYGHGSYSSSSSPYGGGYGQGGGGAYPPPPQTSGGFGYGQGGGGAYPPPPQASGGFGYGNGQGGGGAYPPPPQASGGFGYGYGGGGGGYLAFPPGTHPEVERAFRAADRDCSGAIDERELQGALSSAYHRFSIRTVRLLMFLFNDPATSTPSTMGNNITVLSICLSIFSSY